MQNTTKCFSTLLVEDSLFNRKCTRVDVAFISPGAGKYASGIIEYAKQGSDGTLLLFLRPAPNQYLSTYSSQWIVHNPSALEIDPNKGDFLRPKAQELAKCLKYIDDKLKADIAEYVEFIRKFAEGVDRGVVWINTDLTQWPDKNLVQNARNFVYKLYNTNPDFAALCNSAMLRAAGMFDQGAFDKKENADLKQTIISINQNFLFDELVMSVYIAILCKSHGKELKIIYYKNQLKPWQWLEENKKVPFQVEILNLDCVSTKDTQKPQEKNAIQLIKSIENYVYKSMSSLQKLINQIQNNLKDNQLNIHQAEAKLEKVEKALDEVRKIWLCLSKQIQSDVQDSYQDIQPQLMKPASTGQSAIFTSKKQDIIKPKQSSQSIIITKPPFNIKSKMNGLCAQFENFLDALKRKLKLLDGMIDDDIAIKNNDFLVLIDKAHEILSEPNQDQILQEIIGQCID